MKKEIVIVAALHENEILEQQKLKNDNYFLSGKGHWHCSAANQCLAAIKALRNHKDNFLVKVLTSTSSNSIFARTIKLLNPDILLCGYPVVNKDQVVKAITGSYGVFFVTDVLYDRDESVTIFQFERQMLGAGVGNTGGFDIKAPVLPTPAPKDTSESKMEEKYFDLISKYFSSILVSKEEASIGRTVADACLEAGVSHVIYCTQMHVFASIGLRSDPCDAKAHIADYMTEIGLPKTFLVPPMFYEDFLYGILKPTETNQVNVFKIVGATGHIAIDTIALEDFGSCVRSVFENSKQWIGKTATLSGDKLPLKEYARIMTCHCEDQRVFLETQVTPEEFMDRNEWNGAEDAANYFDYLTRCVQRNNQIATMTLNDSLICFYDWAKLNKSELKKI